MSNYIRLNNNNSHLSLGNLFNIIKKLAINKSATTQSEIFCTIFNVDCISDTTINNYCTGYRAIGNDYKQIYLNYQKKYSKNITIMLPIINNLLSIINSTIYNYEAINDINNNKSLKELCHKLHTILKNDIYIKNSFKQEILILIQKNNYYEAICKMLFYIILEKKQPLYEDEIIENTIEEILTETNISINDLKKYLTIKFKEGINLFPSLKLLAEESNPYALYELGNLEYTGRITGNARYDIAYNYYQKAATYNHPAATWMLANMIINKKIGSLSNNDLSLAWNYLQKAKNLGSISAINTIGICYLNGYTLDHKKNIQKAIEYFNEAINKNYIYAYNNLGKIYESKKQYKKAFSYYIKAANMKESYACNKVAEFLRLGLTSSPNLTEAFKYYNLGMDSDIYNLYSWNIYNLVKYYYFEGSAELGIKRDLDKSITLLESIKNIHEESNELLLYSYYERYLENKSEEDLKQINNYLSIINKNINIDISKKIEIENNLKNISYQINIPN